jgi:23S rRNA (uracil1939-C5)-methyltransferase
MKKGKSFYLIEDVHLEKFVNGGQALGYSKEGKPIFVWGGLPGELVDVFITKSKRGILEGVVELVKTKSDFRVEPAFEDEYLSTSPWQILDFKEEGRAKLNLLKDTFRHGAGIDLKDLSFEQPDANSAYGYRNKMEYSFWGDEDGLSLALFKRGKGQKIRLSGSGLASAAINNAAKEIVEWLNRAEVRAGDLKSLVLRSDNSGRVAAALFVKREDFINTPQEMTTNGIVCYYSNPKSPASVRTKELWRVGEISLEDTVGGKVLRYDVNSFFQINVEMFNRVLEDISKFIAQDVKRVLDLYGGVGSIGIGCAADKARELKIVDIDEASIEMAKLNIKGMANAEAILAASEESIDLIASGDLVILDPPRSGLHKKVVQRIIEVKPEQIIYLSCNPVTQARDINILAEAGYSLEFYKGYNFFPRTPHIESLVVLKRGQEG